MIRAVATDIDGTFLTRNRQYDRDLFKQLMTKFNHEGLHFIVASGDQFFFIHDLVEPFSSQMGFVAENGAVTAIGDQIIDCGKLKRDDFKAVIDYLDQLDHCQYIICGRQSAYVPAKFPADFRRIIHLFYTRVAVINSLADIDDTIFKFAVRVPADQTRAIANDIENTFAGIIRPTVSGNGAIDLIIPGMDKSHGLKLLLKHYGIKADELAVFGDGYNDLEMFNLAGTSYAMANAADDVKRAASQVIGTNDDQAVLHQLAKLFLQ